MRAAAANAASVGQIVKLAGETGIGKSWLVRRFLEQINGTALAAVGQCVALSSPRPLAALAEMSDAFGKSFAMRLSAAFTAADPVGHCLDAIGTLPHGSVLVFEDVHEADVQLCDLLRLLCRRIAESRLLLVMTFRPAALANNTGLKDVLADCPTPVTSRINIPPLGAADIRQICRQLDVDSAELVARCGGNPFLLVELADFARRGDTTLPPAIAKATARCLRQLRPGERKWIELLAITPPPFQPSLVKVLSQAFELRLSDVPADCELLRTEHTLEFRSPVQRDAVLSDLSAFQRMEMERDVLEALANAGYDGTNPESFLQLALACDLSAEVARVAMAGAAAAEARGELRQCVDLLEQSLPHAQQIDPQIHGMLLEAWACRRAVLDGISDDTIARVRKNIPYWEKLGLPDAAASTCLLMARLHRYRAEAKLADGYFDRALSGSAQTEGQTLARVQAEKAMIACVSGDLDQARAARAKAQDALPTDADALASLHVRFASAATDLAEGRYRNGMRLLEACYRAASRTDQHELAARMMLEGCDVALLHFDLPRAEAWMAHPNPLTDGFDANCWRSALAGRQAIIMLHKGELHSAVEMAEEALAIDTMPPAFTVHARTALIAGRARLTAMDVEQDLQQCETIAGKLGDTRLSLWIRTLLAENAMLVRGNRPTSLAQVPSPNSAIAHAAYLQRMQSLWSAPADASSSSEHQTSGNTEVSAIPADWQRLGYPFEAAVSRVLSGEDDPARTLKLSLAELAEMGALSGVHFVQQRAAEANIVLGTTGRKRGPYRAARAHPLGLTRREVDILKMIVEGAPNRDIAARLNRSLRTIEHHVSNILGKMSMESRVQAALHAITNPSILENGDDDGNER